MLPNGNMKQLQFLDLHYSNKNTVKYTSMIDCLLLLLHKIQQNLLQTLYILYS